jgi:GT2 family glycosyltransferase
MNLNNSYKLSVIIVSFNSSKYLEKCLATLKKYLPGYRSEIIVVDNDSEDRSVEIVKKNFPGVRLIENKKNLGFSKANNIAIKNTSSEYVMLLNSDCRLYKDSLDIMIDFMDKNRSAGISGPKIINSDGSIQYSCRRFPSFFDAGMHSILANIIPDNPFSRRYKLVNINRKEAAEVDWVSGSCMLIRRSALNETGLLDEKYFMYVEDIDLCFQMWKKGWKVYYNPEAQILHHIGGSTGNRKLKSSIMMQKSVLYFFLKNYKRSPKILFIPFLLIVLGLRIFLTFIKNLLK